MKVKRTGLAVLLLSRLALGAGSGADALMESVKVPNGQPPVVSAQLIGEKEIKLTDPFLLQFYTAWQSEKNLPYDVNAWALRVMKQDYTGAAHLISAMESRVPDSFAPTFHSATAYLYWKLGLSQTFFDEWTRQLAQTAQRDSRTESALELTLQEGFDKWLLANAIRVSPAAQATITKLDPKHALLYLTLQAWTALRRPERARPILEALPPQHALKTLLARSVALSLARKGDLGGAGVVLKRHLEPALEVSGDPRSLADHYLQIARLLYQAGALDASENYYSRVPNGTPEFLTAQEELTWIWLRKNNLPRLRGELVTLGSQMFDDQFAPEVFLVRAISNLKLCYYEDVEQDFRSFLSQNGKWAKRIDAGVQTGESAAPTPKDFFSVLADTAVLKRENEVAALDTLGTQSVNAALPAVGVQSHWVRAHSAALAALELDKKQRADEYRRQWKNQKSQLTEAIRKMQFVKVELLTQVHSLQTELAAAPQKSEVRVAMNTVMQDEGASMNFPFDGVIWPDELFRLRSIARGRCPGGK